MTSSEEEEEEGSARPNVPPISTEKLNPFPVNNTRKSVSAKRNVHHLARSPKKEFVDADSDTDSVESPSRAPNNVFPKPMRTSGGIGGGTRKLVKQSGKKPATLSASSTQTDND